MTSRDSASERNVKHLQSARCPSSLGSVQPRLMSSSCHMDPPLCGSDPTPGAEWPALSLKGKPLSQGSAGLDSCVVGREAPLPGMTCAHTHVLRQLLPCSVPGARPTATSELGFRSKLLPFVSLHVLNAPNKHRGKKWFPCFQTSGSQCVVPGPAAAAFLGHLGDAGGRPLRPAESEAGVGPGSGLGFNKASRGF